MFRCFLPAGRTPRMSPRRFEKFSPLELMFAVDCARMEILIPRNYTHSLTGLQDFQNLPDDQKVNLTASCTCRGSPAPCRRNPSKLKSPGVTSGLMLFALLKVLNISMIGMIEKRWLNLIGR